MIELVLVYCLVSDAKSCTEKRLRMEAFSTPMGCTMSAQQRAQEYLQEHPTFMLKSWRCEVNVPRQTRLELPEPNGLRLVAPGLNGVAAVARRVASVG